MNPSPSSEDNDQPPVLDYAGLGARYGIGVVRDGAGYRVFVPRLSLTRSASTYLREMPGWKRIIAIWFVLVFSMPLLRELFTSAPTLPGEGALVLFLGVAFVASGLAVDFLSAKRPWQSAVFEIQPDKLRVCVGRLFRTPCYSWPRSAVRELAVNEATDSEGDVVGVKLGVWSIEGLELKLLQRRPKEELDCLASTLMELLAQFGSSPSIEKKANRKA